MPTRTPIDPLGPPLLASTGELVVVTRADAQVRSGAERLTAAAMTDVSALDQASISCGRWWFR